MLKLAQLLEMSISEDNDRATMLAQKVKNPETGEEITVKTALGYDKSHPARKAAAKVYAQFMQKQGSSNLNKPAIPSIKPRWKDNRPLPDPSKLAPDTRKYTPNPDPSTGGRTSYGSQDDVERDRLGRPSSAGNFERQAYKNAVARDPDNEHDARKDLGYSSRNYNDRDYERDAYRDMGYNTRGW